MQNMQVAVGCLLRRQTLNDNEGGHFHKTIAVERGSKRLRYETSMKRCKTAKTSLFCQMTCEISSA